MKRLLSLLALLSLSATANTDSTIIEDEAELGITPIEIEAPPKVDNELVLDLPDYHEDTIVKKIEIDKKHRHKNLKYQNRRIKKNM